MRKEAAISLLLFYLFFPAKGQQFFFGNDLSYVNQMEDCGAIFKEGFLPKDVYKIFAERGTDLVRVRLWKDPSWWQAPLLQPAGVKPFYNDLADVKKTIQRSKAEGMQVMLDIHYSDFWADPGRQLIPRAWIDVAYDLNALKDSVYQYTHNLLTELHKEDLLPEFLKVGNENNPGILKHIPVDNGYDIKTNVSNSWSRHAALMNSAIKAIRDYSKDNHVSPKIAVHFSGKLSDQKWHFQNLINNGVSDFDIMGISYYYAWHQGSISELESTIRLLKQSFSAYDLMVVETGYLWSTKNHDQLVNIINIPDPSYLPVIPEKQLEYMIDYTRAVMRGGGNGVIFWEPAWVSTPCKTPWGTGSSHDHVAFFDPVHTNFMDNGGGMWMQAPYYDDLDTKKITFKVDMTAEDYPDGVFIAGTFSAAQWEPIKMTNEGNGIFSYYTYLTADSEGGFIFLNGPSFDSKEFLPPECSLYDNEYRKYKIDGVDVQYSFLWGECMAAEPDSVKVTFVVDMTGQDVSRGVFLTGDQTGHPWRIVAMTNMGGGIYSWFTHMKPGAKGAYYFLTTPVWDDYKTYRETVPPECAVWWNSDRGFAISSSDTIIAVRWGSCEVLILNNQFRDKTESQFLIFPNPARSEIRIRRLGHKYGEFEVEIFNMLGFSMTKVASGAVDNDIIIPIESWSSGYYVCVINNGLKVKHSSVILKPTY